MAPNTFNVLSFEESCALLGVSLDASEADVTKAYKRLARHCHPDKNPAAPEQAEAEFKRLAQAYEVLRDPRRRLSAGTTGGEGRGAAATQGHRGGSGGPGGSGVCFDAANDVFAAFFRGGSAVPARPRATAGLGAAKPSVGVRPPPPWPGAGSMGDWWRGLEGGLSHPPSVGGLSLGGLGSLSSLGLLGVPSASGRRPLPAHIVPTGTGVVIRGLMKSPHFNGRAGTVRSWDEAMGCYGVELEGQALLSLRPHNLTQRCSVEVVELEGNFDARLSGEIFNYDEDQGRYMVLLRDPPVVVGLLRGNCLLKRGTRVVTRGLGCERLNGQMAQILDVDRPAARYTLLCRDGQRISIGYDQVLC